MLSLLIERKQTFTFFGILWTRFGNSKMAALWRHISIDMYLPLSFIVFTLIVSELQSAGIFFPPHLPVTTTPLQGRAVARLEFREGILTLATALLTTALYWKYTLLKLTSGQRFRGGGAFTLPAWRWLRHCQGK